MIAFEGNFALSFLAGILATVNPCGFVLLPTYLMYFLGTEGAHPGTQRASLRRALIVSAAVSGGFFVVFLVIGLLSQAGLTWLEYHSQWFSLAVACLLIVFGVALLFGMRLPLVVPKLDAGGRDRGAASMFLYGASYAVASLGCTIGPFISVALKSANRHGYASAVIATSLYGIGMGITLTALTVALASARTGLLTFMRRAMAHLDLVAGVLMILTGLYLGWYWLSDLRDPVGDKGAAVHQVERWQTKVQNWINNVGAWPLAIGFGGVTVVAVVFVLWGRDRPAASIE